MMESNSGTTGIYAGQLTITGNNSIYNKKNGASSYSTFGISDADTNVCGNIDIDISSNNSYSYGIYRGSLNLYHNSILRISSSHYGIYGNTTNSYDKGIMFFETGKIAIFAGNATFNDETQIYMKLQGSAFANMLSIDITSSKVELNIDTVVSFISATADGTNFKAVEGGNIIFNGNMYKINNNIEEIVVGRVDIPPGGTLVATGVAGPTGLGDMLAENSSRVMEYQADKTNKKYSEQYKKILEEYDNLLADSSYQGINLLKGGKLEVAFNESRSNQYSIAGVLADSMSLGLGTRDLFDTSAIKKSLEEITKAVNSIRSFQEELGNHYSIIKTRINFTEALTDVLETGADNLTSINSLSLASQSARSVLSLF